VGLIVAATVAVVTVVVGAPPTGPEAGFVVGTAVFVGVWMVEDACALVVVVVVVVCDVVVLGGFVVVAALDVVGAGLMVVGGRVATGALVTVPVGTVPGEWRRPARVQWPPGRFARTKWLAVNSMPRICHEQHVTTR
jgi:hypothetical protein